MKREFCIRCNTIRDVKVSSSSKVITNAAGERRIIRSNFFHCDMCKSFVRREEHDKGGILNPGAVFTPRAKNIWRAIPADSQYKILNSVWCTYCRNISGISSITAKVDTGVLVLTGKCSRCGSDVARVVDND